MLISVQLRRRYNVNPCFLGLLANHSGPSGVQSGAGERKETKTMLVLGFVIGVVVGIISTVVTMAALAGEVESRRNSEK